jgi:hypothetical protein
MRARKKGYTVKHFRRSLWLSLSLACASLGAYACNLNGQIVAEDDEEGEQAAIQSRAYTGGHFSLDINGASAGWVSSVEGGGATADVIVEKVGADPIVRKHLGPTKYEDITVITGTGMSAGFWDWIVDTFDRKPSRRSGAIVSYDAKLVERQRRTFQDALITEIGFPAADAADKAAGEITLKFSPELTKLLKPGHGAPPGPVNMKQKKWLTSNFRFALDGVPGTTHVNRVEAIVVRQKVVENPVGEQRDYAKEPANLEIPNIVFTIAETHADELYEWHEDFVINGNMGQDKERSALLEYLAPDLSTVLLKLNFFNCGIFKLTPDDSSSSAQSIARLRAELYCEDLKLEQPVPPPP